MPTLEELAALLCQLQDARRIEYAKCNEDGTVSVPNSIPCCGEKTADLSLSELLSLVNAAKDPCCPENLELLGQILEALLDDAETSNYTLLCSSSDPTVSYLTWFEQPDEQGGAITPYHIVVGNDTPVEGLPPDAVRCPDTKVVENCFVTGETGSEQYYTRVLCLANSTVLATLWVYPDGSVSDVAPVGASPCENEPNRDAELKEICGLQGIDRSSGFLEVVYNSDGSIYTQRTLGEDLEPIAFDSYKVGICVDCTSGIDTCFLPDQYAYQWAWQGNSGWLQRYDPLTQVWDEYCQLVDPDTGATVAGFALAFQNDLVDPRLWFQAANGDIYYANPEDPCGTLTFLGNSGLGPMPCFDFDPSGRLLIGNGVTVWEIDQNNGSATSLGNLIDVRDGQTLSASPGDWMFGPDGSWYMMARDNAGATYGECTGTVLWSINPTTLEATRISDTCAPASGTGATWLSGGQYLLSTSTGVVYRYNEYTDEWEVLTTAPRGINDLAAEWVIPEPIRVAGKITWNENGCETDLFSITLDESFNITCQPFEVDLPGIFGKCETDPNPFVTDPLSPDDSGCDRCPDEDWHLGCSDAGPTYWRRFYDPSGNELTGYLYGSLTSPTTVTPPGFSTVECAEIPIYPVNTSPFCNTDSGVTVYRREENSVVTWFDETGTIPEPPNKTAGVCPATAGIEIVDTIICLDGVVSVRRETRTFVTDADGLPQVDSIDVLYFNQTGTVWDSTVDATPEPTGWYIGECASPYIAIDRERLCEIPDKKLLMIDSGGSFTEISDYDGSTTNIAIPVPSAGAGADIENYILYAVTQTDQLLAIDVNTRTQLYSIPLFTNDGSVLGTAAASFNPTTGELWYYDYGTDEIYAVDVLTGEVSYVAGSFTGIAGSGSSMAINPVDGKVYVSGSGGRIYELDPTGANTAAVLVYDSPSDANGLTFGSAGELYFGSTSGNASNYGEVFVVRDFPNGEAETYYEEWTPGVNSLAYYEIQPNKPSCFNRVFGVLPDGSREFLEDRNVSDDSPRTVVGAIDCCECSCSGSSDSGGSSGPVEIDGPVEIAEGDECSPGYESITGTSSWTPPANAISVTVTVARGTVDVTTPNGSGTMWNRTSQNWNREEFGSIGWGNFEVTGLAANSRIQIGFMVC